MNIVLIRTDCRHFRGDVPCLPHKQHGVHCDACTHYQPVGRRILIIKLGAIGDVIRTTPLLRRLKSDDPTCDIHWLTLTPEVVPSLADHIYRFEPKSLIQLQGMSFDLLFNLDKDREACSLTGLISAKEKKGFCLDLHGRCAPLDEDAREKWLTGLFDDVSRANPKSYPKELFEVCGMVFNGEDYLLDPPIQREWALPKGRPIVGLNTGCGGRWTSRLWAEENWIALAKSLQKAGCAVVLLGGEQEEARNLKIASASGAHYFGAFPLPTFMSLVAACDLVVTAVTMALHIAIGYHKKIVLLNNIFNRNEFELYGRGLIVEPTQSCRCYFKPQCTEPIPCLTTLGVNSVHSACKTLLALPE